MRAEADVPASPKYGNDDDYVDEIYDELSTKVPEMCKVDRPDIGKAMLFISRSRSHCHRNRCRRPAERQTGTRQRRACSVMPACKRLTAAILSA